MIDEIINFENSLEQSGEGKDFFPKSGLNFLISIENNEPIIKWGIYPHEKINHEKIQFDTEHFNKCGRLYSFTTGLGNNKRHDRKNESCNLFSYILTNQSIDDILTNSDWDTSVENFKQKSSIYFDFKDKEQLYFDYEKFIVYLKSEVFLKLREEIYQNIESHNAIEKHPIKAEKILIFFDTDEEYYKNAKINCIKAKSGKQHRNKKKDKNTQGNCLKGVPILENEQYKESDILSGFSDRKEFLQHRTAVFKNDYKISSNYLTIINDFFTKLKGYPKPLPIFIDKEELNRKVVSIFEKDKKSTFEDIFEKIYTVRDEGYKDSDLQHYYLLYAQTENKKMVIKDFEFVPSFTYKTNYVIDSVFDTERKLPNYLADIFDFQKVVVRELFDDCLFRKDDKADTYSNNYWGEVKSQFCKTNNNYRLILQYRKAFYDFIYKSKKQAITGYMLKDIVLSSLVDVLQDEKYRPSDKLKEERIKLLLNLYFSINQNFDKNNINFNKIEIPMATKTKELQAFAQNLVSKEEKHFEENEDMEFAFCFGQVVYYLLSQSEASNKNHSLLLAYLQKADFDLLKQKAKEDFTKYSYKISFNNRKFNKICSEILGYTPQKKFNDLNSFFLAGYFSKNVIY